MELWLATAAAGRAADGTGKLSADEIEVSVDVFLHVSFV